ncbi:MAG TPA: glycosyltransferase family 39 protein [Candidatus Sulfopaludibacter sp.]|jgi:4-amino-4-deoxy-L-arabinose transferase-like glycosyltransferase|nr:glycosyltransferase family 39 protein [Candidatus Sulfopaludibacter sp.]
MRRNSLCAAGACFLFLFAGSALAPLVGLENDEALFAGGIYPPRFDYALHVGPYRVPLMLMSYVGALKSWLYAPLLSLFGPGLRTLREPMLLAGALAIWFFFLLLRRTAGERAALIGCILLATDSMYLVTTCFDWGPVALQHLLITGGMLLVVKFYQERGWGALSGGFFLFGLALWDKAIAVWMLTGLAAAAIVFYRREVRQVLTARRAALACAAFLAGALPLLVYNAQTGAATFRQNAHRDTANLGAKAHMLVETIGGPGLFGWLTAEDSQTPSPHRPHGLLQQASAGLSHLAGHPRHGLLMYGFLLALALLFRAPPRERRMALFALLAMAVAWLQMALTQNAGTSVHHTILLWPLPEFVMALSFAALPKRIAMAATGAIALSGLLLLNEYSVVMLRNGGAQSWNDGVLVLSDYLKTLPPQKVCALDWAILDPLRFLNAGQLDLVSGPAPGCLSVAHTKAFEFFPLKSPPEGRQLLIVDHFGRSVFVVTR